MRGYHGVGIYHADKDVNLGTLWRHAMSFGASFMFTVGREYEPQSSDTTKSWRHIPLYHYPTLDGFLNTRPRECRLVCVENHDSTHRLSRFQHPERAMYLLGNEGSGVPRKAIEAAYATVEIPANYCLNVAVTGTVVMYDRMVKNGLRTRMDSGGDGYAELDVLGGAV